MNYDNAVKLLTRPYDNKLTKEQADAIKALTDRVEYLEETLKTRKIPKVKTLELTDQQKRHVNNPSY